MKKFSIIIPAYNAAQYISECLESIAKQNFKDYEIIIINDNSQDMTAYKIIDFRKKYPDIEMKYTYNQRNLGVGVSRNIGIKRSIGEYLLFIDSDDQLSSKDALSSINDKLNAENPDILIFGATGEYRNSKERAIFKIPLIPKVKHENKKYQLSRTLINYIWPLCIKRELVHDYDIKFQEDLEMCEDVIFRKQIMSKAKKIKTYSKVCYTYNRRLNRKTLSSNPEDNMIDKLKVLINAYLRLKENMKNEEDFNLRQAKMSFFIPAGIAIVGNHLLSKVLCRNSKNGTNREKGDKEI